MNQSDILQKLFNAADNHGEDSGDQDHTVGDLQDLLRLSWGMLSMSQRRDFLEQSEVETVIDLGAREEFSADDLKDALDADIEQMFEEITAAGYNILDSEKGFTWATLLEHSADCSTREDAIGAAHADLTSRSSDE